MRNSDIRKNQLMASFAETRPRLCPSMRDDDDELCVVRGVGEKNRPESDDTPPTRFSVLDLSECCIQLEHLYVAGAFHANWF